MHVVQSYRCKLSNISAFQTVMFDPRTQTVTKYDAGLLEERTSN